MKPQHHLNAEMKSSLVVKTRLPCFRIPIKAYNPRITFNGFVGGNNRCHLQVAPDAEAYACACAGSEATADREASAFAVSIGLRGIRGNPDSSNAGRGLCSVEPPPMADVVVVPPPFPPPPPVPLANAVETGITNPPPWPASAAVLSVEPVFALLAPSLVLIVPSVFVVVFLKLLAFSVLLVESVELLLGPPAPPTSDAPPPCVAPSVVLMTAPPVP